MEKGIADGRRPDLVGGGLICRAGGWSVAKAMRSGFERMKGDERKLGEGDFVETVLKTAQENLQGRYRLAAEGLDYSWLVGRVAGQLAIESVQKRGHILFCELYYVNPFYSLKTLYEGNEDGEALANRI